MEGAWVVGEYVCTRILSCVVLFFRGGNITEMSFGITEGYVARYALTIAICIGRFLQLKKRMRDAAGGEISMIYYIRWRKKQIRTDIFPRTFTEHSLVFDL